VASAPPHQPAAQLAAPPQQPAAQPAGPLMQHNYQAIEEGHSEGSHEEGRLEDVRINI
jgi:hypothetical protein